MNNGWVLPDGVLRDAPAYTPRPHELADLELLLTEVYAPLTGFLSRADLISVARTGRLVDGSAWPVPITLDVPTDLLSQIDVTNPLQRVLVLTDTEGAPVAAVDVTEVWPTREGMGGVAGVVRRIGESSHGPF
jgi:sulfate adenylyltransferase